MTQQKITRLTNRQRRIKAVGSEKRIPLDIIKAKTKFTNKNNILYVFFSVYLNLEILFLANA